MTIIVVMFQCDIWYKTKGDEKMYPPINFPKKYSILHIVKPIQEVRWQR